LAFVDNNGTKIYYEVHGAGPAVLFVHGSGGHHAAWWQQVAYFRDRYAVLTVDLRGFGRSSFEVDGAGLDATAFPGDVVAVLDDAGIDEVVLVGQSIGASAALMVAMADPGRAAGVVLAHSLGGIAHAELSELVKADRAEAEKIPVLDRLMSRDFQDSEPAKTFLFQQMGTFNQAKMADLRNLASGGPTLEEVTATGVPVLFLAGENDAVLRPDTVRRAHELLPGSALVQVQGRPHRQSPPPAVPARGAAPFRRRDDRRGGTPRGRR
jgi:pimeloyl-ACP methyl ester carboxylesterase